MNFSIRRYYICTFIEFLVGSFLALSFTSTFSHFIMEGGLSIFMPSSLSDFSWLDQNPLWGKVVIHLLGFGFSVSLLQILWSLLQWMGACYAGFVMRESGGRFGELNLVFHAFRRIACLMRRSDRAGSLPSVVLAEQRHRFISEKDHIILDSVWRFIRSVSFLVIFGAWLVGIFIFYSYVVTSESGQDIINNIRTFFYLSSKVFFQISLMGLLLLILGFISSKSVMLYLMYVDNIIYDDVLSTIIDGGSSKGEGGVTSNGSDIRNMLLDLYNRIERFEEKLTLLSEEIKGKVK